MQYTCNNHKQVCKHIYYKLEKHLDKMNVVHIYLIRLKQEKIK